MKVYAEDELFLGILDLGAIYRQRQGRGVGRLRARVVYGMTMTKINQAKSTMVLCIPVQQQMPFNDLETQSRWRPKGRWTWASVEFPRFSLQIVATKMHEQSAGPKTGCTTFRRRPGSTQTHTPGIGLHRGWTKSGEIKKYHTFLGIRA